MAPKLLHENLNALVVFVGFVALEGGVAAYWSAALAAMVGGAVLMLLGAWPYLRRVKRKGDL